VGDDTLDSDLDGVCDDEDVGPCIDDVTFEDICADACLEITDNFCTDSWDLTYCVEGEWYYANCQDSCTTDEATWGQVCAAPALAGECSAMDGACLCWCEDSFDSCVDEYTVQYDRDGTTYQVDCGDYCAGTCDAIAGACACP
jgi:hypothetical protein